jgi:hypothetical protein
VGAVSGKLTISRQERLARLGGSVLYGRVVSDYGEGPRWRRLPRMALRGKRGGLHRWGLLRREKDNFENILTFLCR